jgi:hypothetical protein
MLTKPRSSRQRFAMTRHGTAILYPRMAVPPRSLRRALSAKGDLALRSGATRDESDGRPFCGRPRGIVVGAPCLTRRPRLELAPTTGGFSPDLAPWRGGRVVECTALEMRHRCKPIGGSNPSLSATTLFSIVRHHPKFLAKSAIYSRSPVLRCSPVFSLVQG